MTLNQELEFFTINTALEMTKQALNNIDINKIYIDTCKRIKNACIVLNMEYEKVTKYLDIVKIIKESLQDCTRANNLNYIEILSYTKYLIALA